MHNAAGYALQKSQWAEPLLNGLCQDKYYSTIVVKLGHKNDDIYMMLTII